MAVSLRLIAVLLGTLVSAPAVAAPKPRPPSFAMCGVCHVTAADQRATLGPNLWGVGGRRAGGVAGFTYSPAMRAQRFNWDRAHLIAFITNPRGVVPGTRMAYAGQRDPAQAAALADYLLSLK